MDRDPNLKPSPLRVQIIKKNNVLTLSTLNHKGNKESN